jgi:hypothetical protein
MKTRKALIEEIEKLKEDNKRLTDTVARSAAKAVDLQEQFEKVNRGERCDGEYCAHCKHGIEGEEVNILTEKGCIICPGTHEIICALSIPCPDFQRKE